LSWDKLWLTGIGVIPREEKAENDALRQLLRESFKIQIVSSVQSHPGQQNKERTGIGLIPAYNFIINFEELMMRNSLPTSEDLKKTTSSHFKRYS
jgi:hypothetical protein